MKCSTILRSEVNDWSRHGFQVRGSLKPMCISASFMMILRLIKSKYLSLIRIHSTKLWRSSFQTNGSRLLLISNGHQSSNQPSFRSTIEQDLILVNLQSSIFADDEICKSQQAKWYEMDAKHTRLLCKRKKTTYSKHSGGKWNSTVIVDNRFENSFLTWKTITLNQEETKPVPVTNNYQMHQIITSTQKWEQINIHILVH